MTELQKYLLEEFDKVGIKKDTANIIYTNYARLENEKDARLAEYGVHISKQFYFSENYKRILNIIFANPKLDTKQISQLLNLEESVIKRAITDLLNKGYLNDNEDRYTLTQNGVNQRTLLVSQIQIMYSYELSPRFQGENKIIESTRDFCRELIAMNKLYKIEEINLINSSTANKQGIPNFTVFNNRGGWRKIPNTNTSVANCRHIWAQQIINL